jgi:hypothetical protein
MRLSPLGSPRRWAGVLVLGTLLAIVGCGSKQGKVSGTVKYKDQPLKGGKVTFFSGSGEKKTAPDFSEIDESGRYSVSKLPPGEYTICVETEYLKPSPSQLMAMKNRPKDAQGGPNVNWEARAKLYTQIPIEYAKPETSKEKFQVKPGSQDHDILLK